MLLWGRSYLQGDWKTTEKGGLPPGPPERSQSPGLDTLGQL